VILNSRTYQAGATPTRFNYEDRQFFSRYRQRLLSAEQLLDAVCRVTGVAESFAGVPPGTPATQLPAPDPNHPFLSAFGQPPRQSACACERSSSPQLAQALQLLNGPLVNAKLKAKDSRARRLIAEGRSDEEIIEDLYFSALSRRPTEKERAAAMRHVKGLADRATALTDITWAVLNLDEFLFQH
jgi:hypothetical protein